MIPKFTAVWVVQGDGFGFPRVDLTSLVGRCNGVTMTDSEQNEEIRVMARGRLTGVTDTGWTNGETLYAPSSSGVITNVRPAATERAIVHIGTALGDGAVDVHVFQYPRPEELSGVLQEATANLDVAIWDSALGYWVMRQIDHNADLANLAVADPHPQYLRRRWIGMVG